MHYLQTVCGKKKRFNSLKALFIYLERELSQRNIHKQSYLYSMFWMLGDEFNSKAHTVGQGYEDTRNPSVGLFRENCSFRGWNLTTSRYHQNNLVDGEKCVWLATKIKYIVKDECGQVVSIEVLKERYTQRYNACHRVKCRYNGHTPYPNGVRRGYKSDKKHSIRLSQYYKERAFSRSEVAAMTSVDEHDVTAPLRNSRIKKLKWLAEYNDYGNYRDVIRSWKSQSKKRKQWM
ncbi:hypothetical protein [Vibrio crassostreae]|uniref:hypothetical protein n=1 Tax=Vibrio crassostreae TaxID=246167 RepID=UPI001B30F2F9|nr:hypothetical protein [Vibrio crassostreae]